MRIGVENPPPSLYNVPYMISRKNVKRSSQPKEEVYMKNSSSSRMINNSRSNSSSMHQLLYTPVCCAVLCGDEEAPHITNTKEMQSKVFHHRNVMRLLFRFFFVFFLPCARCTAWCRKMKKENSSIFFFIFYCFFFKKKKEIIVQTRFM